MPRLLLHHRGVPEKSMTFLSKWKAERMSPTGHAGVLGAVFNTLSTEERL